MEEYPEHWIAHLEIPAANWASDDDDDEETTKNGLETFEGSLQNVVCEQSGVVTDRNPTERLSDVTVV